MRTQQRLGICAALLFAGATSATAAPFCAVFSYRSECLYFDLSSCMRAAGTTGMCSPNRAAAGDFAGSGMRGDAGPLTDATPKAAPYNELKAERGAATIYEPSALRAQEEEQENQSSVRAGWPAPAYLLQLPPRPPEPLPAACSKDQTDLALWAKENGYSDLNGCH